MKTLIRYVKLNSLFQSLGNHEFDSGVDGLIPFIEHLKAPVLAANLHLTKVPELANQTNLRNHVILNIKNVKLGIVGYLTPETKTLARKNNVDYIDEIVALKEEVKKLQNEGVKIIIGLGHSGYLKDLEIAKEVEGLDLVIGGHTNTFLYNGTVPDVEEPIGPYPTYVRQTSGKMLLVPVVQAYGFTKYLGRLHLVFNDEGEITSLDGSPILLDKTIPQDPDVLKIVEFYQNKNNYSFDEVIGESFVLLDGASCPYQECNLGNLITDAIVYYYAKFYQGKFWTDAPIATVQAGTIRSSIANTGRTTNITKSDLIAVIPFDDKLVKVRMNGTILLKMIEKSVANYDLLEPPNEFLQYSGIKIVYDLKQPPGSRVLAAVARCSECVIPSYSKVEKEKEYEVLMPDFLALGGDGYSMLKELPKHYFNFDELDATRFYIQHNSPIIAEIEGRITLIGENVPAKSQMGVSQSLMPAIFSILSAVWS